MREEIGIKIIQLDNDLIKKARKLRNNIAVIIAIHLAIVYILEQTGLWDIEKTETLSQIFGFYLILLMLLLYLSIFRIGYIQEKHSKKGQLNLDIDGIYIKLGHHRISLNHEDYKIKFEENGYEGKSHWNPITGTGALIIDSGNNEIFLINRKKPYKKHRFDIFIENKNRLDNLEYVLMKIKNKYQ